MSPVDLLLLTNGPGEVTTWVLPVVKALRALLGNDRSLVRISVVLSPCVHAMGTEAQVLKTYGEVDRVQEPQHFFPFLLTGRTAADWDWHPHGVVVFLGGDQLFALLLAKRLGYKSVVYAEWEARWYRWLDSFAAMNGAVVSKVSPPYRHKLVVVGDLMVDLTVSLVPTPLDGPQSTATVALLMGSKPSKLSQGVPFTLTVAEYIQSQRPQTRFFTPLAPTVTLERLAQFAQAEYNPVIKKTGWSGAQLVIPQGDLPYLETPQGLRVRILPSAEAQARLAQSHLALTTVGANTAQLAALQVPMVVLIPTQQLDAMRSWDGLPGLLANLPLLGSVFARGINWVILQQKNRLYAWPNIWATGEIVPELVGNLIPAQVGDLALDWLARPEKLQAIRDRLGEVCGSRGAAAQIAQLVARQIDQFMV